MESEERTSGRPSWFRRKYLVDVRFQGKLMAALGVSALFGAVMGALIVAVLFLFVFTSDNVEQTIWTSQLGWRIFWICLSVVVAAGIGGLFMSHKVVGPMVRLSHVLESMASGDFSKDVRIRRGDYMQEFFAKLDGVVSSTRKAVLHDREASERVSVLAVSLKDMLEKGSLSPETAEEGRRVLEEIIEVNKSVTGQFRL
ncbi:hypothetical protein ACFL1X_07735 [Candidatus Hydrogenedentota bacterium]